MLRKVLIANRGEIAVRIIRACRDLQIASVAVWSDADRDAMHMRMADEAVHIGAAPSTESYLDQQKILDAAAATGADAIHPGYGFLSENAGFARRVQETGLTWIGPDPDAMDRMGDKTRARAEAEAAGVPIAPGSDALADPDAALAEAQRIGFPVMLKASAGGGGIGMRIVTDEADLAAAYKDATAQAAAAFGVPDVFLEKFIERPRHIEVQILADHHGNVIHLGERECSIQRRHQKLIEEAPSPALTEAQRADIGAKAVALAKQVGYRNAGTLEFLYEDGQFFFNEMNTRLQVEHPVTELVTGVDLVHWQLRIAAGEKLTLNQEDIQLRGHAVEARINAEDPARDWLPCPGPVEALHLPGGPGVRVDTFLETGWTVPSDYDSMVAKLIGFGSDRDAALRSLGRALDELRIEGFGTNASFHQLLLENAAFQAGDMTTRFLEEHAIQDQLRQRAKEADADRRLRAGAVALALTRAAGGIQAVHWRQQRPARITTSTGMRDWEAA